MKFLILALCVCAANAASFGLGFGSGYKPSSYGGARAVAQVAAPVAVQAAKVAYTPAAVVAKAVVGPVAEASPVVRPAVTAQVSPAKSAYVDSEAQVVRDEFEIRPDSFNYYYETDNGIAGQSTGTLKQVGESQVLVQTGSYRYVGADGVPVEVTWVADENGYQAQGDHIPVAPPVPEAIARAIEYTAARARVAQQN